MVSWISKRYSSLIVPFSKGGEVFHHTRKKVWIGVILYVVFLVLLEVFSLVAPMPFDFLIELSPVGVLFFVLVVGVILIVVPYYDRFNSHHELAENALISVEGLILSGKRKERLLPYDLIMGGEVQQSILGRVFNFGDICVGTRMTGKMEVRMCDIDDPHHCMNLLEEKLNKV